MYDIVAEITEEPTVTKAFNREENTLEAPGYTPWFDAYMKLYLQSIPTMVRVCRPVFFRDDLKKVDTNLKVTGPAALMKHYFTPARKDKIASILARNINIPLKNNLERRELITRC